MDRLLQRSKQRLLIAYLTRGRPSMDKALPPSTGRNLLMATMRAAVRHQLH
jgi:hypothetical protein